MNGPLSRPFLIEVPYFVSILQAASDVPRKRTAGLPTWLQTANDERADSRLGYH
jgi:hypothetical protein